ncbi:hypothetical protein FACS18949_00110 [Clostridia bacterium]|nr:hypothetical protein FACS18949_00110 [Clostridia bacterium]
MYLETLGIAALGYVIVFAVLLVIMGLLVLMTAIINKRQAVPVTAAAAVSESPSVPTPAAIPDNQSLGEIKLNNVDEKTAAMLMAIVANGLKAPLNELRFISIKEKGDSK